MRGTVNKNITKPLHEILRQVSQYSIRTHHDLCRVQVNKLVPQQTGHFKQAEKSISLSKFGTTSYEGILTAAETGNQSNRFVSRSVIDQNVEPNNRHDKDSLKSKQVQFQNDKDVYEKTKKNFDNKSTFLSDSDRNCRDPYNISDPHLIKSLNDIKNITDANKSDYMRSIINGIPSSDKLKNHQMPLASMNSPSKFSEINKEIENTSQPAELSNSNKNLVLSRCESVTMKPSTNFEPLKVIGVPENTLVKKDKNEPFHTQKNLKQESGTLNKMIADNVDKNNLQIIIRPNQQNRPSADLILSREEGKASESIGLNKTWNLNRVISSESKDVTNTKDNSFPSISKVNKQYEKRDIKTMEDVQDRSTDIKFSEHFDNSKKNLPSYYPEKMQDNVKLDVINRNGKSKGSDEKRGLLSNLKITTGSPEISGSSVENRIYEHNNESHSIDLKGTTISSIKNKKIDTEKINENKIDVKSVSKEICNPCEFHPDKINSEKITKMLKEHRMLLEVLLDKVNLKITDICSKKSKKRVEFSGPNNESPKPPTQPWNSTVAPQEKLKRLSPPAAQLPKPSEREINSVPGKTLTDFAIVDEKDSDNRESDNREIFAGAQLRASVTLPIMTLQTSPSQMAPSKASPPKVAPIIDGTKLSYYNYSPLKQILSQCVEEKLKLDEKFQNWKRSEFKKQVTESKSKESDNALPKSSQSYTAKDSNKRAITYLKFKQLNEKKKDKIKQDLVISKIKKSAMMYNKKKMNSKDSRGQEATNVKNILQLNKLLAAKKMFKIRNNIIKPEKDTNTENTDSPNLKANEEKIGRLKLSKGVYFSPPKNEIYTRTSNNSILGRKKKKLDDLGSMRASFSILSPTKNLTPVDIGLESTGKNWHAPYLSHHTVQGPLWKDTNEYCFPKDQWELPLYKEKIRRLYKPIQKGTSEVEINPRKTIEHLTSLSRKFSSMPPAIPSTSSPTLALKFPFLKSSVLPLSASLFKLDKKGRNKMNSEMFDASNVQKFSDTANIFSRKLSTFPLKIKYDKPLFSTSSNKIVKDDPSSSVDKVDKVKTVKLRFPSEMVYRPSEHVKSKSNETSSPSSIKVDETCRACCAINEMSDIKLNKPTISDNTDTFIYLKKKLKLKQHNKQLFPRDKVFKVDSFKYSWWKAKANMKNMISPQSDCCMPNFDKMSLSISKHIESDDKYFKYFKPWEVSDEKSAELKKEQRAKELALVVNYSGSPEANENNLQEKPKESKHDSDNKPVDR